MSTGERFVRPAELRTAVQQMGAALLAASKETSVSPELTVHDFLAAGVDVPRLWAQKGNRYGHGNAISGRMREHAIEGHGEQARFRYVPEGIPGRQPRARLQHGVQRILAATSRHLNGQDGGHTVIMDRYSDLGSDLPPGEGTIKLGHAILSGADYPDSICEYSFVVSELMKATPAFASASAEVRRDAAHTILRRAIGREASMHAIDFIAAQTVLELHEMDEASLRLTARGEHVLDLGAHRQAAGLRVGASYDTPPLACAAHQLRPGEPETDLQTFIHAGVNLAHELSMFGTPAATAS